MTLRLIALIFAVFTALPAAAAVDIQAVTSKGGFNAWLVENHSIPFVSLEIRFKGGASLDLPGKKGATNLMVGLLEEGAGDMDARAFARATESLATSFGFNLSDDAVSVSARFLTENRDQTMTLLRDALIHPRFDPDAVERVRTQVLSNIKSDLKSPRDIASRAFQTMVFGDHPYGQPQSGTLESVAALTRDDLIAAHQSALAKDRVFISAVGDIDADELATLMDGLLAELPEKGAPLVGAAMLNFPGGVKVVPFDTPQSVAIFGQKGIDREDPDFFAAFVLDNILGGGSFESRLMQEVREKRGLTYGIYSFLADKDQAKLWMGSVASANDRIAQAVQVIRDEWVRLAENGVTQQELDDSKTYLTGVYPLRFDSNSAIANIMVAMQMSDMPIDYIATRNDMVNAVTLDDVNRVAKRLLDPEHLSFVVVGQPEGLAATD
ncbi:pitrilysin family protein [Thalassovita sp.]|uniref:M16 family metallopeptidase n=1 Tax=Thalassovita sp. TaxID=1979401 RepID=UPI002B264866|nr:pitrilysin family protein [Thalassovita sp.]